MDLRSKSIKSSYLYLCLLLLSCCHSASVQGLKFVENSVKQQFKFAASQQQPPEPSQATDLARQLITGTIRPNIVNNPAYCVCVPPGSCPNPVPLPPTDGSGQIDIRIVNNPFPTTMAPYICNYGLVLCCQAGAYQCGRRYPPPPGSTPPGLGQANFGEYPWQVALLFDNEEYFGSGALISPRHVLTAAHKVYNLNPSSFQARLGEWDASSINEPIPAQDFSVSNIYAHPNFNSANLQNDVAILRLSTPVSLTSTPTIATICLPTVPIGGPRCYVSGWGKNDFGPTGAYQAIQREVDVSLLGSGACQAALRRTRLGPSFVLNNASFICAGGEPGKDACTGDGGSPLVCQANGIWYVIGMVAWGIGCAMPGVPGVYVNVATFLPWIQTILATS